MGINNPSDIPEFSKPVTEILTKAQKAVIERVIAILTEDPNLNKEVSEQFQKNFLEVTQDKEKFNLLLEKIGVIELQKLGAIQAQFDRGEIKEEQAKNESKEIITQYTKMKLTAFKSSLPTPVASA